MTVLLLFFPQLSFADDNVVFIPCDTDCSLYFECSDGFPYLRECPPGLHFNATTNVCDWPGNAGCKFNDLSRLTPNDSCKYSGDLRCPEPGGGGGGGGITPACSCKITNTSDVTHEIPGGRQIVTTKTRTCNSGNNCTCAGVSCPNQTSYNCACNSGYTAQNQGTSSCNCFRCDAGFYVTGTNATPTCTKCPAHNDNNSTTGSTSANNVSKSPTSCYLSPTTTFTDTKGSYTFTRTCNYTQ